MPSLLDLFRLNNEALRYNDLANAPTPERLRNLPPPPVKPEWDISSGEPEPGLEQVTPEEWIPPGAGMKLASLAKGLAGGAAALGGVIRPMGSFVNPADVRMVVKKVVPRVDGPSDEWLKNRLSTYLARRGGTPQDEIAALEREELPLFGALRRYRPPNLVEESIDRMYRPYQSRIGRAEYLLQQRINHPHKGLQSLPDAEDRLAKLYSIYANSANKLLAPGAAPWSTEATIDQIPDLVNRVRDESVWREGTTQRVLRGRASALSQMVDHYRNNPEGVYTGPGFRISMGSGGDYTPFRNTPEQLKDYLATPEGVRYLTRKGTPENFVRSVVEYPDTSYLMSASEYNPALEGLRHLRDLLQADQTLPNRLNLNASSFRAGLERVLGREMEDIAPQRAELLALRRAEEAGRDVERERMRILQEREAKQATEFIRNPGSPGALTVHSSPDGWRVDQILTPQRAKAECLAGNATWCTKNEDVAERYLNDNQVFVVRNPEGIARSQFTIKGNKINELQNRTQQGDIQPDQGRQVLQEFVAAKKLVVPSGLKSRLYPNE